MIAQITARTKQRWERADAALIGLRVRARISYSTHIVGTIKQARWSGSVPGVWIAGDDGQEYDVDSCDVEVLSEAGK